MATNRDLRVSADDGPGVEFFSPLRVLVGVHLVDAFREEARPDDRVVVHPLLFVDIQAHGVITDPPSLTKASQVVRNYEANKPADADDAVEWNEFMPELTAQGWFTFVLDESLDIGMPDHRKTMTMRLLTNDELFELGEDLTCATVRADGQIIGMAEYSPKLH